MDLGPSQDAGPRQAEVQLSERRSRQGLKQGELLGSNLTSNYVAVEITYYEAQPRCFTNWAVGQECLCGLGCWHNGGGGIELHGVHMYAFLFSQVRLGCGQTAPFEASAPGATT